MEKTTIQISNNTLERLKSLKRFDRESYEEIINLIIDDYKQEELSLEEIEEIEVALKNVKEGKTKPIEQVAKELGIELKCMI